MKTGTAQRWLLVGAKEKLADAADRVFLAFNPTLTYASQACALEDARKRGLGERVVRVVVTVEG